MRGVRMAAVVVASLFVLLVTASVAMAQAQDPYGGGGPQVSPRTQFRGQNQTRVGGELLRRGPTRPSERAGLLPFTGADLTLFVATGLVLTATGVVIVRRTRARSES